MFWSLTFQLLPDEIVVDDSSQRPQTGIKPAYSVFITNRRVIFRFDGLGSSMSQSFFFDEILDVKPARRLFFSYLQVTTGQRQFLLNTTDVDYWTSRILEIKKSRPAEGQPIGPRQVSPERKKRELLDMLTVLRKHSLLTDEELEEKIHALDAMKF